MNITQFETYRAIYTSGLFYKVELTPTAKLVIIAMAHHYNPENPYFFPSQASIAEKIGCNRKSVNRAVIDLTNKGLITYETKKYNRYKFTELFFKMLATPFEEEKIGNNLSPISKSEGTKCNTQKDKKSADVLQNVPSTCYKITHKHIKENINNTDFFKNFKNGTSAKNSKNTKQLNFSPSNEGVNYKTPEQTREEMAQSKNRDEKSPYNDLDTAVKYLQSFTSKDLQNTFIKRQVDKVSNMWGLVEAVFTESC